MSQSSTVWTVSFYWDCTCVAKLAPDENPPTVMVFASIEGTFGKELPEGGGGVGVRHPWDKVTL